MKTVKRKASIGDRVVIKSHDGEEICKVLWVNPDNVVVRGDGYTFNVAHEGYSVVL